MSVHFNGNSAFSPISFDLPVQEDQSSTELRQENDENFSMEGFPQPSDEISSHFLTMYSHVLDTDGAICYKPEMQYPGMENLLTEKLIELTPAEKIELTIQFLEAMQLYVCPEPPFKARWVPDEAIAKFLPENLKIVSNPANTEWTLKGIGKHPTLKSPYLSPYQEKDAEYGISIQKMHLILIYNALTMIHQLFQKSIEDYPGLNKMIEDIQSQKLGIQESLTILKTWKQELVLESVNPRSWRLEIT